MKTASEKDLEEELFGQPDDEVFYLDLSIFPLIAKSKRHLDALRERLKLWGVGVRVAGGTMLNDIAARISDEHPHKFPGGGRMRSGDVSKYDITFEEIMRLLINAHIRERAAKAAKEGRFLRFLMMSPTRKKILFKF